MFVHPVLKRLFGTVASFSRADQGNIAVIFAITMVPMIGAIGAAVDYSRVINARTAMQTALDTAALMISKEASTLTAAQITTKAQAYFNALCKYKFESRLFGDHCTKTIVNGGSGFDAGLFDQRSE